MILPRKDNRLPDPAGYGQDASGVPVTSSPAVQFTVLSLLFAVLLAGGLATLISSQVTELITHSAGQIVGHQVSASIRPRISAQDLEHVMPPERVERFDRYVQEHIRSHSVVRIKIWNRNGLVVYADDVSIIGRTFTVEDELKDVLSTGNTVAGIADLDKAENISERGRALLLEVYAPLVPMDSRDVLGAFEVYLNYAPIHASIRKAQRWIWGTVLVAVTLLWSGLYWIFDRAGKALEIQRRLATTDPLTGLYNRRYFMEQVALERKRLARYGTPFSVVVLDIDHFKTYNDTFGHPAGDAALCDLAKRLRVCVRDMDTVARIGGEEFAILLPYAETGAALRSAERIRAIVEDTPFPAGPLTASLGVAPSVSDSEPDPLAAADKALYKAKNSGRNRVCSIQGRPFPEEI